MAKHVADQPVTSVLPGGDVPFARDHGFSADEEMLAALGYKSEFKREFSLFTTFCVSFAVLGLLPSFASTLFYGMGYAGTAGMTWGWVIAMVGIQSVACSMAELCSSMPTSGGLYYAAAVLAPPGWGPFAAWVTGWSNWLGQVTAAPSGTSPPSPPLYLSIPTCTLKRQDTSRLTGWREKSKLRHGCDDTRRCVHTEPGLRPD